MHGVNAVSWTLTLGIHMNLVCLGILFLARQNESTQSYCCHFDVGVDVTL